MSGCGEVQQKVVHKSGENVPRGARIPVRWAGGSKAANHVSGRHPEIKYTTYNALRR